jgi:serine/threonine protein kinase
MRSAHARIVGGFETRTGIITGSPVFTAREVLKRRTLTPASDVYSLGTTLFCALTGDAAVERRSGEQMSPNSSGSQRLLLRSCPVLTSPTTFAPRSDMRWRKVRPTAPLRPPNSAADRLSHRSIG